MFTFCRQQKRTDRPNRRLSAGFEKLGDRQMMTAGPEFTLGSPFTDKFEVDTASADNGMSVAVWNESGDIRGQLYAADGAEIGQVMNIATGRNNQHEPDVSMDADGSFVVAWTEDVTLANQDIRFRAFSITSGRLSGVGNGTSSSLKETQPSVAMADNGTFVISFTRHDPNSDTDVRFQRFNALGTRQGGTIAVSTSTSQREFNSDVAMTPGGEFVVAFEHRSGRNFNSFDQGDIRLGRFAANGTRLTGNTVVARSSRGERDPEVAVDDSGNAVVVFHDQSLDRIRGRRIRNDNTRDAPFEVRIAADHEGIFKPTMSMSADGNQLFVAYATNAAVGAGLVTRGHAAVTELRRSGSIFVAERTQDFRFVADPAVSVDGNGNYFFAYVDTDTGQAMGRWGRAGRAAPGGKVAHDFDIDLRFTFPAGVPAADQQGVRDAAQAAVDRWERVIVGDLSNQTFSEIDDILIDVTVAQIPDSPGRNVLGSGNVDFGALRNGSSLPFHATFTIDIDDVAAMNANGSLGTTTLHEMGHALGIGGLWNRLGLVDGRGGTNPTFNGTNAIREFNGARGTLGALSPAASVPVANNPQPDGTFGTPGDGSFGAHWREANFGAEIMTPTINAGTNPLSRITIGSLEDMGYTVNYAAADLFAVAGGVVANRVAGRTAFASGNASFAILADDDNAEPSNNSPAQTVPAALAQADLQPMSRPTYSSMQDLRQARRTTVALADDVFDLLARQRSALPREAAAAHFAAPHTQAVEQVLNDWLAEDSFPWNCDFLDLERVLKAVAEQPMTAGGNYFASLRNGSK